MTLRSLAVLIAVSLAIGRPSTAQAQAGQAPLPVPAPVPGQAPAPVAVAPPVQPEVAPDSPRASFLAFMDASNAGQWEDATRYLALTDRDRPRGAELAERLKGVIDSLRLVDPEAISADPKGRLDDRLPADVEEIAEVPVEGGMEPMRLVRRTDDEGAHWAFSRSTVARIDRWYDTLPDRWLRDRFVEAGLDFMIRPGPFNILWWQWIVLPFVGLVAWGAGRGMRAVARPVAELLAARTRNVWDDQVVAGIGPPFTLAFAIVVFAIGCVLIQLTRQALDFVGSFTRTGMAFAFFWALWRLSSVLAAWAMSRPWAVVSASARHLLSIGSNILRGVIVGLGVLAMLNAFGYPVGTVLAGLGIGGLALAFGAQKTLENVFGSVSLAVDQPFRIGDFVKVEDFVGTVEGIGLRSTRFRTLDRTLVSIPNGKLADQRLESFEARDRMRLATTVSVTYGTTRAQIQAVLEGVERVLREHPRIWPDAVVVKFKELGASSLDIEIMAWFQVPTWADFQRCREEVLLGFMQVVEEAGTSFAFPTRTIHLVTDDASNTRLLPTGTVRGTA